MIHTDDLGASDRALVEMQTLMSRLVELQEKEEDIEEEMALLARRRTDGTITPVPL